MTNIETREFILMQMYYDYKRFKEGKIDRAEYQTRIAQYNARIDETFESEDMDYYPHEHVGWD